MKRTPIKINNRLILVIGLSILLTGASCVKKPIEKPTYYMSQEFKDYILFPVGSWWMYENPETGEEDSLYLFWQEHKIQDGKDKLPYNFEWVRQTISSSFYNDTLSGWGGSREKPDYPDFYEEGFKSNYIHIYPQFFSDKDTGYVLSLISNNLKYEGLLEEYIIQGDTFKMVKKFNSLRMKYPLQPQQIYYAPRVGVIKKELFDGTVWELKRYYINI